ncbi:ribonuclease HIII [Mycoplasma sp. HS2188]|uniref:ribonuclease HIII n=1 Tax=Mycoplasma sp. HS2188 TaxID=2976765 RepID=UPI0021AA82AE|nr:ribonuclease HIII [Mycoplasma sp. HS2188]MCT4469595.1 ribonuclease HIII [Mycoplasma sp. HS2188]
MKIIEYNNDLKLDDKLIIGIDEVGVGDYFGPLIAAAVLIPQENKKKLLELGVTDSKKIIDNKIKILASKIRELTHFAVYTLTPKGYNNLSQNNNANELKMFVHLSAISSLLNKNVEYQAVFIDKYSTTKSIEKYFAKFYQDDYFIKFAKIDEPIILANKAESLSLEVACASILAREKFIYKMQEMNSHYQVEFPFGASNAVKAFAKHLWSVRGDIKKEEVCKNTFKMDI